MDSQPPIPPPLAAAAEEGADRAADQARDRRRDRVIAGLVAVTVIACAVGGWQLYDARTQVSILSNQNDHLSAEQQATQRGEQALYQQVQQLGARPVVQPPASPAPAATQQQIDAAVASWFAAHPPGPTPAEVALAVAEYLVAHPPATGPPPTPDQISTAAADYIAAHATEFTGQPGANATDAQVVSAVDAYCSAHNDCTGAAGKDGKDGQDGATGPQGVSITDLVFQRNSSGACQAVVTLHDPATGTDNTVTHPAGDAACPLTTTNLLHPGK